LLEESRKRVSANVEGAWYELLESLVVNARLRMEVGEFPKVDWRLIEVKHILKTEGDKLDESRSRFYWGKYYHIQAKSTWRGHFYQRAFETFTDGIEFFEAKIKRGQADRTNIKYLCKLYEGLAHLECEALLFDWADANIEEAEALYDKHAAVFNRLDKFKFLVKKSSFQKKFGFFDEALEILIDLEKQVSTML
jgi:hypothetical protein